MRYAAVCVAMVMSAAPGLCAAPPPVGRDANGDPLPRHALFRLGSNRLRTPGIVSGVALSPDGRTAAATAQMGMLTPLLLWDLPSGRLRARLEDPAGRMLNNLLFSPDGKTLTANASGYPSESYNGFCVWDVASGQLRAATSVPGKVIGGWAFSPDGKILAGSRLGEGLLLFDATTGRKLRTIAAPRLAGRRIAFSPDGTLLAVPMLDATVVFFRVASGKVERTLPGDRGRLVFDLVFSPDGHRLATMPQQGGVRIVDLRTGKAERTITLDTTEDGCRIHYTEGERVLVALGSKGTLSRLDARTGKELSRWANRHERFGASVGVTDDAKNPILLGEWGSCELRLIDLRRGVEVGDVVAGNAGPVNFLAVSPDGRHLAAGSGSGWNPRIRLWDLTTRKPGGELVGHTGGLTSLVWTPDGKRLATASGQDESIRLWDPRTCRCLNTLPLKDFNWPTLAFAPGGKSLAVSGFKHVKGFSVGLLGVWDVGTMKQKYLKETIYRAMALSFVDDVTLTSQEGGELRFRDIETGKLIRPAVPVDMMVWPPATSSDGSTWAGHATDESLCILEAQTGSTLTRLRVVRLLSVFALSPDGEHLALCAEAGLIELFDATSGARLAEFRHPVTEPDVALAFTPDGTRLLSGGNDCTVLVWDVRAALRGRKAAAQPLNAAKRREHWVALGSREPAALRAALIALRADPEGTLLLADTEFRAMRSADDDKVRRLVAELDADSFAARERASRELAALGEQARPALVQAAREGGSAEVKKRATALLSLLGESGLSASQLRALRAVRLLERIGGSPARKVLERVAGGNVHDPVTRAAVASLRRRKTIASDAKE